MAGAPAIDGKAFSQESLRSRLLQFAGEREEKSLFFPGRVVCFLFLFLPETLFGAFFLLLFNQLLYPVHIFFLTQFSSPASLLFLSILYHKQKNFEKTIDSRGKDVLILYQSILQ